jgi:hypothetical protein
MLVLARPQPDRRDVRRARVEEAGRDRETDLRGPERHRHRRAYRDARHFTGRRVHARRHVDGDHRAAAGVDQFDHPRCVLTRRVAQTDAQQRIDDHVRLAEIADTVDDANLAARLLQDVRADLAIAAVVPLATDDGHAARELAQDDLRDRGPRALHQLFHRPLVRLLGAPRLLGRQQWFESHSSSRTTATAAASSRECVIESSIFPAPTFAAHLAVRPERKTPGFGLPRTSISFHVK